MPGCTTRSTIMIPYNAALWQELCPTFSRLHRAQTAQYALPMRAMAFVLLSRRFPSAQMPYRLVVFQDVFDLRSQLCMNEWQPFRQIFVHRTFGYTKLFGDRPHGMSCVYDALTDDERALPYRFVHPHRPHRMDGAVYGHTTKTMRKKTPDSMSGVTEATTPADPSAAHPTILQSVRGLACRAQCHSSPLGQ